MGVYGHGIPLLSDLFFSLLLYCDRNDFIFNLMVAGVHRNT